MALKVDYVAKETATNLRRNLTLTFATMVTIAIALTCVGAALLMKQGVANADVRFHGGIESVVFMTAHATQDQIDAVDRALKANPHVESATYLDHDASYAQFRQLFIDQPEIANSLTPADTPTTFKIKLSGDATSDVVASIHDQFKALPGVYDVVAPTDAVKKQESSMAKFSTFAWIFAAVVGGTSIVLIVNSIRIAMFARRREIEVMKLVGATNWFIRIPFMAEGLLQGIVGSAIGIGIVIVMKWRVLPLLVDGGGIWTDFHITNADLRWTSIVLVVAGAIVGVIGSAMAATRFLDV
jgi:cell division transport system permease protein